MHSVNGKGDEKNGEYKGSVYWGRNTFGTVSESRWGDRYDVFEGSVNMTPEELEEFHRDAIKLMEESEQQKEVAIQG